MPDARAALRSSITEKDFQTSVLMLAGVRGWSTYHTFDSRRSAPGFPDLVMVRDHDLIFAELKSEAGKVTDNQARWLDKLDHACIVHAELWRPSSWPNIEAALW